MSVRKKKVASCENPASYICHFTTILIYMTPFNLRYLLHILAMYVDVIMASPYLYVCNYIIMLC